MQINIRFHYVVLPEEIQYCGSSRHIVSSSGTIKLEKIGTFNPPELKQQNWHKTKPKN
jgi:hypothetical protein